MRHPKRDEEPDLRASNPAYIEVTLALRQQQRTQFDEGRLLTQVLEEPDALGPHDNFIEFVKHECAGMSERQAYRLIFAFRMNEVLAKAKCPVMPTHESQVRPLSRLPEEELKLKTECWRTACHLKKEGKIPTAADVNRAVLQVLKPKPSKRSGDTIREYRQCLTRAQNQMTKALDIMADSEFQNFLSANGRDKIQTPDRKVAVEKLKARVADQLATLAQSVGEQATQFELE